jgi:hypothetical protein
METHDAQRSDLKIGLLGLAIAVVWLSVVAGFSYWLAVR